MLVVLITSPKQDAEKIAKTLLEKKLSACVNIVDSVSSLFLWQGKIDRASESLLIAKTTQELFNRLEKEVLKIHPYDIPEIISFKLANLSNSYQKWLNQELSS